MNRKERREDRRSAESRYTAVAQKVDALRRTRPEAYFAQVAAVNNRYVASGVLKPYIDEEVRRGYEQGYSEATENTGVTYIAAMCLALNELHGFDAKRLLDVTDRITQIMYERITSMDVIRDAYKKLGLRLTNDDPMHWVELDD